MKYSETGLKQKNGSFCFKKFPPLFYVKRTCFQRTPAKGLRVYRFSIYSTEEISPNAFQVVSNLQMYFRRENPE